MIGNSEKVSRSRLITEAARLIARSGREVLSDEITARMAGLSTATVPDAAALTHKVDLMLVFGGDGTMLRVAAETAGSATPILGINIGGLGFLTGASAGEMPRALDQIWAGNFALETRALIEVRGQGEGRPVHSLAMNDFVISRGLSPRLVTLEVRVDGEVLTRYRCDGLIVSSPTGSTAYSLSAGGAVVHPTAEVFEITPICPHTLSNRPVIVSLRSAIGVQVVSPKPEIILSADGRGVSEMSAGDSVVIRRSRKTVRLLRLPGGSFFETLRTKLHWSGANV